MKMKIASLLLLFVALNFNMISAQNYHDAFKSDICECLNKKELTYKNIENEYNKCFASSLVSYAQLIDASIDQDDKNLKYIEGQKARRNLRIQFKDELMHSCDKYFYTYERAIYKIKEKTKQLGDSTELQRYRELVAMSPNWQSYFYRGQQYYKLNDLKGAEQDALKSIELSPTSSNEKGARAEKLFLAQIYEDQKRYNEAINTYDQVMYYQHLMKKLYLKPKQIKLKLKKIILKIKVQILNKIEREQNLKP